MIRFGVILLYPVLTWDNATSIPKEAGVEVALNNRERLFSETSKGFLFSRIKVVDPLVKYLNIDKLVAPARSLGLRLLA